MSEANSIERTVGRPANAGTNEEGPRGTYGCACVSSSPFVCLRLRHEGDGNQDLSERCECLCHEWRDDDE